MPDERCGPGTNRQLEVALDQDCPHLRCPLEEGSNTALRDVRFMPKPWRALEVLIEAEKASDTHRMGEALGRGHAGTH